MKKNLIFLIGLIILISISSIYFFESVVALEKVEKEILYEHKVQNDSSYVSEQEAIDKEIDDDINNEKSDDNIIMEKSTDKDIFPENENDSAINFPSQNTRSYYLPILPINLTSNTVPIGSNFRVRTFSAILANRPLQYELYSALMRPSMKLGYREGDSITHEHIIDTSPSMFNQYGHPGYARAFGWRSAYWISSGAGEVVAGRTDQYHQMLDGINGVGKELNDINSTGSVPRNQTYTTRDGTIRIDVSIFNNRVVRVQYTRLRSAPSTNPTISEELWLRTYNRINTWHASRVRGADSTGFGATRQVFWNNGYNLNDVGLLDEPPLIKVNPITTSTLNLGESVGSPENYITVTNRMEGGSLRYEWITEPSTTSIGKATGRIRVTDTLGEYVNSAETEVQFDIVWGNTIGSTNAFYPNATGFSISLIHEGSEPNLVATLGNGNNPNNWIHDNGGRDYISLNSYSANGSENPVVGTSKSTFSFRIDGRHSISDSSRRWNNQYTQQLTYGDVLSYSVRDTTRISNNKWAMRNNSQRNENPETCTAFYELTKNGFRQLMVGRITPHENNVINTRTSDTELAENILDYLNIPNHNDIIEVFFTNFPSRSQAGQTVGHIKVRERLQTGNSIYKSFEIPFTVENSPFLGIEISSESFNFGKVTKLSRNQSVPALTEEEKIPTITIYNFSNNSDWVLNVSADPFLNKENRELEGATIKLQDLKIIETVHKNLRVSSRPIEIGEIAQPIVFLSSSDNISRDEKGISVIQIGQLENGLIEGLSLTLPDNIPMDAGKYRTIIKWELVTDPTSRRVS